MYSLDLNKNEKCIYEEKDSAIEFTSSSDLKEIYVRYINENRIVHIVDGIIQQEWDIETMQGRYSDIVGEYIF